MPDRADYLARALLSRFRQLETAMKEDEPAPSDADQAKRRQEAIEKILAVEEGITDSRTILLIATAMPRVPTDRPVLDRERDELATVIRRQLKL